MCKGLAQCRHNMESAMRKILESVGIEGSVIEKFEAQEITVDVYYSYAE